MSISRSSIGLATSTQVVKKECFASILSEHRHFLKKCSWLYRSQWAAAVYQATCYSQYVAKKEFVELLCFQASSNALCMQNKKCALWWHFRWIYMVKTQIRSALLNSLGRQGGGGRACGTIYQRSFSTFLFGRLSSAIPAWAGMFNFSSCPFSISPAD